MKQTNLFIHCTRVVIKPHEKYINILNKRVPLNIINNITINFQMTQIRLKLTPIGQKYLYFFFVLDYHYRYNRC